MPKDQTPAELGALGGPVLLAIMGAAVTLWPPEGADNKAKFGWVACFLVVGLYQSADRLTLVGIPKSPTQ
jgi:hypothetical protein